MSFVDQYNAMPDVQQNAASASPNNSKAQPVGKSKGLLGNIASSLEAPFKYFGSNLGTLGKIGAAKATGNQQAGYNAAVQGAKNLGLNTTGDKVSGVGAALRKLAGNTIQLGTDVAAPEVKGLGIGEKAIQGAKIGAAAGAGTALSNNEDIGTGAITGALTGGVTGGALGGLGKLVKAPIESAAGKVAETNATKQALQDVGPFRGVHPNILAENNLGGAMENLKSFGMEPTPQNMRLAAHSSTGENGAISGTMRQILGNSPPVDVGNVLKDTETAIGKEGGQLGQLATRGRSPANNILASMRNEFQSTMFGNNGSLTGKADANSVFDTIQNLGSRIRTLGTEGTDGAERRVLQATKQSLEDKLYNDAGVNDAVKNFKLAPEDIEAIHKNVQDNGGTTALAHHITNSIDGATTGKALRSVQQPFVQMSQLADAADKVAAGKGVISSVDQAAKGTVNGSSVPTRDIYYSMQNPAMTPFLAGDILKSGVVSKTLAKAEPLVNKSQTPVKNAISRLAPVATAQASTTPQSTQQSIQSSVSEPTTDSLSQEYPNSTDSQAQQEGTISQQQLLALVAADPKNASTYISLYNATKPPASTGSKPTAQNLANAQTGLASLQELSGMIQSNPDVVRNAATPGQSIPLVGGYVTNATGAGGYEDAANNVLDAIARIRTGAAMSKNEQKFYQNLLPKAGDSTDTISTKLSQLKNTFNTVLQGSQGGQ